eukprot:TRINITY_DN60181_c0_g1_i1.p1 TRINITY_DN60181_c0_g1~~TRINITY_DN60181_c0_g1_i1.p1  ORF type:complete len:304 (-),score=67.36 TRINITY_DN60181_c0_g1_i1:156-950(-)
MSSAIVRGLLKATPKNPPRFVVSPRNAEKAAKLAAEFPDVVRIAKDNQEVVDSVDCVMIAVLPKHVEEVVSALRFKENQKVLSVIATLRLERLRELVVVPNAECAICCPLPGVAKLQGATIVLGAPFVEAIFSLLGTCWPCTDEQEYRRLQTMTGLMGDFYKRQLTAQQWLTSHGVPTERAAGYVGAIFATMAADSAAAGPETLDHLVGEQTPGGLNEMVWKDQEADGSYESLKFAMDSAHYRFSNSKVDPELAPAKKRARPAP